MEDVRSSCHLSPQSNLAPCFNPLWKRTQIRGSLPIERTLSESATSKARNQAEETLASFKRKCSDPLLPLVYHRTRRAIWKRTIISWSIWWKQRFRMLMKRWRKYESDTQSLNMRKVSIVAARHQILTDKSPIKLLKRLKARWWKTTASLLGCLKISLSPYWTTTKYTRHCLWKVQHFIDEACAALKKWANAAPRSNHRP